MVGVRGPWWVAQGTSHGRPQPPAGRPCTGGSRRPEVQLERFLSRCKQEGEALGAPPTLHPHASPPERARCCRKGMGAAQIINREDFKGSGSFSSRSRPAVLRTSF